MAEKKTRDQLIAELASEKARADGWVSADESRRKQLSGLLGVQIESGSDVYGYSRSRPTDPRVLTWIEIAFKMGELQADADYSLNVINRNRLADELAKAKDELFFLKNPELKK